MPPDPLHIFFFLFCFVFGNSQDLGTKIPILLNFDTEWLSFGCSDRLKSMLYLYQNIFCCCTRIYIFFTEVSQLTVAVRWLGTFANILFFWAPEWHFQCNFENSQVNVWSKHKAHWLANIWFSCSRMLFFVMTNWKNLQLLGALPPDPYQGLCPWTPLGAYCGPQTPTSFSSFFTFPQSHVWCVYVCVHVWVCMYAHML